MIQFFLNKSGFAELFFSGLPSITTVPLFFTCKLNKKGTVNVFFIYFASHIVKYTVQILPNYISFLAKIARRKSWPHWDKQEYCYQYERNRFY